MSEKVKTKAPSYFSKEEKGAFKNLTKQEKGHFQYMREDEARRYLAKKTSEREKVSTSVLRNEINDISKNKIDKSSLSRREADLQKKDFRCKFCGQGFASEEAKTKHQKLCL